MLTTSLAGAIQMLVRLDSQTIMRGSTSSHRSFAFTFTLYYNPVVILFHGRALLNCDKLSCRNPVGNLRSFVTIMTTFSPAPKKYSAFARFLLDGVAIARKDNPYLVPGALRYEEKTTYYNIYILAQQCIFMENHRNIQIKNVSANDLSTTGLLDATIHKIVTSNEQVLHFGPVAALRKADNELRSTRKSHADLSPGPKEYPTDQQVGSWSPNVPHPGWNFQCLGHLQTRQ